MRQEIAYTAVAGYMPLKDDHDKLRANIFYTAYTAGTRSAAATGSQVWRGRVAELPW